MYLNNNGAWEEERSLQEALLKHQKGMNKLHTLRALRKNNEHKRHQYPCKQGLHCNDRCH